jgi:hypothetical protein
MFLTALARRPTLVSILPNALAGKDRADNPQAGRAGDVGDDVVELKIHLCQCLLHMLDV